MYFDMRFIRLANVSFLHQSIIIIILNGLARIFETIIVERFQFNLKHFFHNNGFLEGKSTITNICQTLLKPNTKLYDK